MATGYIAAVANAEIDSLIAAYPWMQLHTGDPGAAGTANVAGNSTRKDVSAAFPAAAAGTASNDVQVVWSDAETNTTETYTNCSFWSAVSGGSCGFTGSIPSVSVDAVGVAGVILVGNLTITLAVAA